MKPYFTRGNITLYHGDCREVVSSLLSVDVVLTDPPYGVELGIRPNSQAFDREQYLSVSDDPVSVIALVNEVLSLYLPKCKRLVMTPGVTNMFKYPEPTHCGSFFYPAATGCNPWGFSCWQPIFYYGKDPYGGKGSLPDSKASSEQAVKNGHPCPKPIGQWEWLLSRVSLPGETILDPFAGSCTTLIAARNLRRAAIGIEIEERYCEIAAEILSRTTLLDQMYDAPLAEPGQEGLFSA